ncbi:MAG: ABC transporter ATP-binding protein [Thermoleophilia bacterium]|nr:ABC transporter ATP-binding protein [Thermoleophilia bacterium]
MTPTETATNTQAEDIAARIESGPVVVEVRNVDKTFRIPENRVDSIKERAVHPFRRNPYRELRALNDISFDVHHGEFFGIVGLNGSGKSTLLKILGSIYKADRGTIRTAGRVAPFIELGVGFNPEMTAYDNVVLNAVMMGLSRREATSKVQSVIDFAGLEEFAELKLKNYSSGMMVRLAFSVLVEAEADIMLIDEVLAVGDASFAQKCEDVFYEMREAGKTIVLVTHDMNSIEKFCHRAMMIHDGKVSIIGSPEEVSDWYLKANFRVEDERPGFHAGAASEEGDDAHIVEAWIEDEVGTRITNVEQGIPFRINLVVEAIRDIEKPLFNFLVYDEVGFHVFAITKKMSEVSGVPPRLGAGERVTVSADVVNRLNPGRYYVGGRIFHNENNNEMAMQVVRVLDFVVFGTENSSGAVRLVKEVGIKMTGDTE